MTYEDFEQFCRDHGLTCERTLDTTVRPVAEFIQIRKKGPKGYCNLAHIDVPRGNDFDQEEFEHQLDQGSKVALEELEVYRGYMRER